MHELSIALDLIDVATEELARRPETQVTAVHLRLGRLSGVVKDALLFSFDVAAAGTPLEGAQLQIEEVPAVVWCEPCGSEGELVDVTHRRCPTCRRPADRLVRGTELELIALEVRAA